MNFLARTLAREKTYTLLSTLFLQGVSKGNIEFIKAIPELVNLIPDEFESDEYAAEFQNLFSQEIIPNESIFRDSSGLLGGRITNQVYEIYAQNGFQTFANADHIGNELAFLAYLCGQETILRKTSQHSTKTAAQSAFLRAHLSCWMPALALSLEQSGNKFYCEIGRLILAIIDDHLSDFMDSNNESCHSDEEINPLNHEDIGLKEIVNYLLSPINCGLYLNRAHIRSMGLRHQLPLGFGNKRQMFLNLFRTSGQYGSTAILIAELVATSKWWLEGYQNQINNYPFLKASILPWASKAENTSSLLQEMSNVTV